MNLPINHMVSSKENSVECTQCHTRNNSRLANLRDFYMPGRDYNRIVETAGTGIILVSIFGVAVHSIVRITISRKKGKGKHS
jgi:hypothetical protein